MSEAAVQDREVKQQWAVPGSQHDRLIRIAKVALPSAVGVLLVLMIIPGGLANLIYRGRDAFLRRLARRRGIVVASLLADVGGDDAPEAIKVALPAQPKGLDGAAVEATVGAGK